MDTEETQLSFFRFYHGVLESTGILHIRIFFEKLKNSVMELRDEDMKKIVACKESDQNAYFFQYGVLHSTVSGMCFQDLIYHSGLFTKGRLNVCVIGGGPGFEVVSLCKLMNDMPLLRECSKISVNVTVIEPDWDWNEFETNVYNSLMYHKEELFDSAKVELKFQFMTSELSEPLDKYVQKAMRTSHILSIVTRPSVKKYDSTKFGSQHFKDILGVMRQGSFLCAIDYTGGCVYESVAKGASESNFNAYPIPSVDSKYSVDFKELNSKTPIYGEEWNEVLTNQAVEVMSGAWKKEYFNGLLKNI